MANPKKEKKKFRKREPMMIKNLQIKILIGLYKFQRISKEFQGNRLSFHGTLISGKGTFSIHLYFIKKVLTSNDFLFLLCSIVYMFFP